MNGIDKNLTWQTIILHWLTAVLFLATFVIGFYMVDLPRGEAKGLLISRHQSLGAILLLIALMRIAWRLKEGPISRTDHSDWQDLLAKFTQFLLLLFTVLMPVSGLMMSVSSGRGFSFFGQQVFTLGEKNEWLFTLASMTHHVSVNWVVLFVSLHVLGAIKRQYINNQNSLYRMFGND
ncbi:cytochrome b/b6 domain-containing protein [Vibrio sp. Sgm 22]|uniref:cytochrome b n=1 Tax=unclassified Vibrio TaxID=2614977 RepID=UPI002249064D|nr:MULTISPECIES: cytochrome b/b6 domain-containing protein [unclassified Vibrio]MCX2757773.1 cytochrome b/b6 domain-containing protein [Vibrio sp. 14G-20]MCX2774949.1 cytochrome b/b6 domain-containing protein [Vibrio sp. Sgm 22]